MPGGLAYTNNDGNIVFLDTNGEASQQVLLNVHRPHEWDPTGRYLIFEDTDDPRCALRVLDATTDAAYAIGIASLSYAVPGPVCLSARNRLVVFRSDGCRPPLAPRG